MKSLIFDRLPATISLAIGGAIVWLRGRDRDRDHLRHQAPLALRPRWRWAPRWWRSRRRCTGSGCSACSCSPPTSARFHDLSCTAPAATSRSARRPGASGSTSLLMPWFVLAATFAAIYARLLRGSLIEVMSEDYIRTARAKGLSERRVILRHGVRSAITPIVTVLGLDIGDAARWRGAHRDRVQHPRHRPPGLRRDPARATSRSIQGTVLFAALLHHRRQHGRRHRSTRSSIRGCGTRERRRRCCSGRGPAGPVRHRGRRRPRRRRDLVLGRDRARRSGSSASPARARPSPR